ncbi:ComEC/Rec2-related protein [Agrobacterium vitis]|nr:ComEC/Rec2-related protein [Agrobacterium vitis]
MAPDADEWQQISEAQAPRPRARLAPWPLPVSPAVRDYEHGGDTNDSDVYPTSSLATSPWQRFSTMVRTCAEQELVYGRAFLFLPVFLGLGAIWWFSRPYDLALSPLVSICGVCAILWTRTRFRQPALAGALGIAALAVAGMVLAHVETNRLDTIILDGPVTTLVRGRVMSAEINASGHQRYVIALQETAKPRLKRMPQQVALLARGKHAPFKPGDQIEGRARLSPPSGPALPGLNDFAQSSYFTGTGAIGYFYRPPTAWNTQLNTQTDLWSRSLQAFSDTTQEVRNAISSRIRFWVPGDAGAFGVAIVTGERRGLSEQANNDLRVSGLAHIISISGLHMALAGGLFFVGIRRALSLVPGLAEILSVKKIAAAGAIATTTGYFLISGYEIAAQRAYLMMVIMLSAAFFDRPVLSLRNTALAAILVVVISPSQVMGPSLQMSFAATFALIAGFDLWRQRPRLPAILPRIAILQPFVPLTKLVGGILMTSALGGFSTAMFSAAHFHRVGLHGLEANLLASPIISMIVMPFAMIGVLLMPLGLEEWPLRLMGLGLDGVLAVASHVASWGAGFTFGRFEWWFLPVSSIGLLVLTLLKTRLRTMGAVIIAFACGYEAFKPQPPLPTLTVTEDGQLVGILRASSSNSVTIATNKKRPPSFIYNQWATALDISETIAAENLPQPVHKKPANANKAPDGKQQDKKDKKPRIDPADALSAMVDALEKAKAKPDVFYCRTGGFCVSSLSNDWIVVQVQDRDYSAAACALADLIVSTQSSFYAKCTAPSNTPSTSSLQPTSIGQSNEPGALLPDHPLSGAALNGQALPGPVLIDRDMLRQTGALEITLQDRSTRSLQMATTFHGELRPWTRHRYYDWRTNTYLSPQNQTLQPATQDDEDQSDDSSGSDE